MTLTNDEVYAFLTAYILAMNKLVGNNDTMKTRTFPGEQQTKKDLVMRVPERDVSGWPAPRFEISGAFTYPRPPRMP